MKIIVRIPAKLTFDHALSPNIFAPLVANLLYMLISSRADKNMNFAVLSFHMWN